MVAVGLALFAGGAPAQSMPRATYRALEESGRGKLARRIARELEPRAGPDAGDVQKLLERWEREGGGPDDDFDWLTVTRLWIRAGRAAEAEMALHRIGSGVPAGTLLLEQARVAELAHDPVLAERAYWKGCDLADADADEEYWADIEPLAMPTEIAEWRRLRGRSASEADLCGFLRRFWGRRAAASAMPIQQRLAQHYARLRFAQKHYRRRTGKKGPTFSSAVGRPGKPVYDDRGLLYLRMGEPARKTSFAGAPSIQNDVVSAECYQPNESWAYDFPDATRVYHFSPLAGTDDWWLLPNLGLVYRCGIPDASASAFSTGRLSPVNEHHGGGLSRFAHLTLSDLYASRQGIDPRYQQIAWRMAYQYPGRGASPFATTGGSALVARQELAKEQRWTRRDAEFAILTVPERPRVDGQTRLLVERLQYRAPAPGATRVWLNGVVEADRLTPDSMPDGRLRYRVEAAWALLDEAGDYRRVASEFETATDHRLGDDESVPVIMHADLPAGTYQTTLAVRDRFGHDDHGVPVGNYVRNSLKVREFGGDALLLSDITVAADSGGSWTPGGGIFLRPSPPHSTGSDGVAFIYYEVYNLRPGTAYETRVRLEPEDGGDPFELEFPGEVPEAGGGRTRGHLRLDLSGSRRGRYDMSVIVTDLGSEASTLPFETTLVVEHDRDGG